jgi:hypothetical protein
VSDAERLTFVLRVLATVGTDNHEDIWWRTDGEYGPVTFWVKCSDLFWWGTADLEELTPENVGLLEQSYRDAKAAAPGDCTAEGYGSLLFCCRVRGLRPQGCCYPENRALWPLIDACGPEREVGFGNPYPPGGRGRKVEVAS